MPVIIFSDDQPVPHVSAVDIILACNRPSPYLTDALRSVMEQTFRAWQLYIIDDGSADPDFLRKAAEHLPHTRVIRRPAAGVSAARNAGLREASAPLVVFLDDDDIWVDDRLERQVAALAQAPGAVGCYGGGAYIDAEGRLSGGGWGAAGPIPAEMFINGSVPLPRIVALMVRREVAMRVGGFDPSFRVAEDNDFMLRLAQQGELLAVQTEVVLYRRHDANTSQADALEGREATRRMLKSQAAAAAARGRGDVELMLRQHLSRQRRSWAVENARQFGLAARQRDLAACFAEMRWAAANHPLLSVRLAWRRLSSVLRRERG